MLKNRNVIRDLIFLCLLIYLTKIAFSRSSKQFTYLITAKTAGTHELDPTTLEQIETVLQQAQTLTAKTHHNPHLQSHHEQLTAIYDEIVAINTEYHQSSPAILMLLGPIAAVSTTIKEHKLEQRALVCAQQLATIAMTCTTSLALPQATTLTEQLNHNALLLKTL